MNELTMRERLLSAMHETIDATLPDGVVIDYHYAVEQVLNELAEPTEAMIEAGQSAVGGAAAVFKAMIEAARRDLSPHAH